MATGNTYILKKRPESDAGEAVDVTGMIVVLEDVGPASWQSARKLVIRIKVKTSLHFILPNL